MRPFLFRFLPALLALLQPSCVHLLTTRYDYATDGMPPVVAGTAFRAEFIPQGTESGIALSAMVVGGATIAEIGPYQLRLHAFGKPGDQRSFRITRFVLSSPGNFTAPMEPRGFEGHADFNPAATSGITRASFLLGPYFRLDEQRDRKLLLEADVEITRRRGISRGTLRLPLKMQKTRSRQSEFILAGLWQPSDEDNPASIPTAFPPPPEHP